MNRISKKERGPKSDFHHKQAPVDFEILPVEKDICSLADTVRKNLDDGTYIVFDIETTGGNPQKNGITEICAFKFHRGKILDRFYSLVNPKVSIPPIVRRMTGIDNKMVRKAPPIKEVMPKFLNFIGLDLLVSHNTIGDLKFLRYFALNSCKFDLRNFFLCTHLLTEKLIPESQDKSLQGLARFLQLKMDEAHRAEADSLLTKDLLVELLVRVKRLGFSKIADVIRFQGDLESGLRLGWGISDIDETKITKKPGILKFYDRFGKKIFLTSAQNCQRAYAALSQTMTLPKQLMRTLLKTYSMECEPSNHLFLAMLAEANYQSMLQLRVEAYHWHMRSLCTIMIIRKNQDLFNIKVGVLSENALHFFGPIYDKKEAHLMVASLAKAFGLAHNKHGFQLDGESADFVLAFLRNQLPHEQRRNFGSLFSVGTLFSSNRRNRVLSNVASIKKLARISMIAGIRDLRNQNGLLILHNEKNSRHTVLPIVYSLPMSSIQLEEDWYAWLYESREGQLFCREFQQKLSESSPLPLTREQAYRCGAVLWILSVREKKGQAYGFEFVPANDLTAT